MDDILERMCLYMLEWQNGTWLTLEYLWILNEGDFGEYSQYHQTLAPFIHWCLSDLDGKYRTAKGLQLRAQYPDKFPLINNRTKYSERHVSA